MGEQVIRMAGLDHPPLLHDHDVVRDLPHDRQVVGDEEVGQVQLSLKLRQQSQDLRLDEHVEGGDRLIQHNDLGPQGQSPGDGHALALAPGELIGVAPHGRAGQGDHVEKLGDALTALLTTSHIVHP